MDEEFSKLTPATTLMLEAKTHWEASFIDSDKSDGEFLDSLTGDVGTLGGTQESDFKLYPDFHCIQILTEELDHVAQFLTAQLATFIFINFWTGLVVPTILESI